MPGRPSDPSAEASPPSPSSIADAEGAAKSNGDAPVAAALPSTEADAPRAEYSADEEGGERRPSVAGQEDAGGDEEADPPPLPASEEGEGSPPRARRNEAEAGTESEDGDGGAVDVVAERRLSEPSTSSSSSSAPPPSSSDVPSWSRPELRPPLSRGRAIVVALVVVALSCVEPARRRVLRPLATHVLLPLYHLLLRTVGTALGVGFGLGFAAYVHETLEGMSSAHAREKAEAAEEEERGGKERLGAAGARRGPLPAAAVDAGGAAAAMRHHPGSPAKKNWTMADENSYASLMLSAGYDVADGTLRGQVLRHGPKPDPGAPSLTMTGYDRRRLAFRGRTLYHFVEDPKGPRVMSRMWPNLPSAVNDALGLWVDHILRDFVALWYGSVDEGCVYEDEAEKRARLKREEEERKERRRLKQAERSAWDASLRRSGSGVSLSNCASASGEVEVSLSPTRSSSSAAAAAAAAEASTTPRAPPHPSHPHPNPRTMVLSTAPRRPIPFLDTLYTNLATLFGTLATYAGSNVNVPHLLLVKFVHVLSRNVKVYRELRKVALEKRTRKLALERERRARLAKRLSGSNAGKMGRLSLRRSGGAGVDEGGLVMDGGEVGGGGGGRSAALLPATAPTERPRRAESAGVEARRATDGGVAAVPAVPGRRSLSRTVSEGGLMASSTSVMAPTVDGAKSGEDKLFRSSSLSEGVPPESKGAAKGAAKSAVAAAAPPPASSTTASGGDRHHGRRRRDKENDIRVSEIDVTREYLLAGKLHRALTFGLDVPSLLFADPTGKECGLPGDDGGGSDDGGDDVDDVDDPQKRASGRKKTDEDEVLKERLFSPKSKILYECELDYNRILSHRLCRRIVPRIEFASPVIRSCAVEMVAGCILTPTMSLFVPECVNDWIIQGVDMMTGSEEAMAAATAAKEGGVEAVAGATKTDGGTVDVDARGPKGGVAVGPSTSAGGFGEAAGVEVAVAGAPAGAGRGNDDEEEGEEVVLDKPEADDDDHDDHDRDSGHEDDDEEEMPALEEDDEELVDEDHGDDAEDDDFALEDDAAAAADEELRDADADDGAPPKGEAAAEEDAAGPSSSSSSSSSSSETDPNFECVIPMLTMSLIELQRHVDFDECRQARMRNEEPEVDWDDPGCRDAVCRLVLVVEYALLHGARRGGVGRWPTRASSSAAARGAAAEERREEEEGAVVAVAVAAEEGEEEEEAESANPAPHAHHPATLGQLLMEMTSDLDAFEARVMEEEERRRQHRERTSEAAGAEDEAARDDFSSFSDDDDDDEAADGAGAMSAAEISTLRTLIAAWMHTGQLYRTLSVFVRAESSALRPFYGRGAFLRHGPSARGFVRQLRALEDVDVLVDTMAVLASPALRIDEAALAGPPPPTPPPLPPARPPAPGAAAPDVLVDAGAGGEAVVVPEQRNILRGWSGGGGGLGSATAARVVAGPSQQKGRGLRRQRQRQHGASTVPDHQSRMSLAGSVKANFRTNRQRFSRLVGGGGGIGGGNAPAEVSVTTNAAVDAATGPYSKLASASSSNLSASSSDGGGDGGGCVAMVPVPASAAPSGKVDSRVGAGGGAAAVVVPAAPPSRTAAAPSSAAVGGSTPPVASVPKRPSTESLHPKGTAASSGAPPASSGKSGAEGAAAHHHHHHSTATTPHHLDFRKNGAFAFSLRTERERRMSSWEVASAAARDGGANQIVDLVFRTRGSNDRDAARHREMHHLARIFYTSTNVLALRDAATRAVGGGGGGTGGAGDAAGNVGGASEESGGAAPETRPPASLLTMETVSSRRRIEVPDDDSSFLLRAQPRPLNPVGVHRDQRNHDQSYKCYAATYEEPVMHPETREFHGGRCIRRCLIRYFPSDRNASVAVVNDARHIDHRKGRSKDVDSTGMQQSASAPILSQEFQRERNICNKAFAKGSERTSALSGTMLGNPVMEPTDFNSLPRTGKAMDFVYRMSLFEKPMVELGGKKFTVHDSTIMGAHRADASSLEISDAALSVALLLYGREERGRVAEPGDSFDERSDDASSTQNALGPASNSAEEGKAGDGAAAPARSPGRDIGGVRLEKGADGSPMVLMKLNSARGGSAARGSERKGGQGGKVEVRPYRPSYIRAALLITSARQEAQLQCLMNCVRSGSARNATKARTEALLQPPLTLLEFANSTKREKQYILLRDLKLGINHIDREQLRRNGLLNPRHPTILHRLSARIEGAMQARFAGNVDLLGSPATVLYKIRCVALVELNRAGVDDDEIAHYTSQDEKTENGEVSPNGGNIFREEWFILRPFRDFTTLHKHLKSQVSTAESSAGAGARLVGAATAAFTVGGGGAGGQKQRKALIPSLGQATKAGALGATKKSVERRKELLSGYLDHLLSPNHLLNRCSEILLFLGASDPLPPDVRTGAPVDKNLSDVFGRFDLTRTVFNPRGRGTPSPLSNQLAVSADRAQATKTASNFSQPGERGRGIGASNRPSSAVDAVTYKQQSTTRRSRKQRASEHSEKGSKEKVNRGSKREGSSHVAMRASIVSKIDEVKLSQVRNSIFELVRHQFDLDNASFFRSRMFSALKTMSFAVTSAQEFKKTLYDMHVAHINGEALAGWIKYGLDMFWPNGIFYESAPELSEEEKKDLELKSKEKLPQAFPDQLRTVLGQEIAQDGLDILHEMLQNRVVLKSMAYMMMDLVWLEVFPELSDILSGSAVLDIDD